MINKIDNRRGFIVYLWVTIGFIHFMISYVAIFSWGFISSDKQLIQWARDYVIIGPIILSLLAAFHYLIKPAYFEAVFSTGQIVIKTFNSNKMNGLRLLSMFNFDKYSATIVINKQLYNNYKITIDRFGFRKILTFQKIENNSIYESKPFDISLLGAKKYTNLILLVDRLREKVTMN
ncbi:MAG TPA: hypothetical protein VHO72_08865 [Bacteroidales bacterium]|nr:hypothetical protein [Bacteroidales bacterium]